MKNNWIMKQTWKDLLFIHWPVDPAFLSSLLPSQLEPDTYDGQGWIALVPFTMTDIRFKGTPAVPIFSRLYELNVRTYVTYKREKGVYFFSLDASNPLGVWIARQFFHLPYYHAAMTFNKTQNHISFQSVRTHRDSKKERVKLTYRGTSPSYRSRKGELAHWLTERYCLFTTHQGNVYRGDLYHDPWELQKGECEIRDDSITQPFLRPADNRDLIVHYANQVTAYFYPFKKV
ncbi:YqjF family protein [Priestia megaterium]|uniref:YqjF family protein n=1 Tax=Priestia megaterium TaxID=1404 RepID=UPI0013E30823|nr:DUF2071 domain-containing protein [Priestia megaterium]MED3864829.1 DUF2071 domain-containing protein [Priestia megaterium]MED4098283.1 DUF2071 domain-containing protein [Priestia megaterium]MED4146013.1 DUF2071 domain-containing protein [Priestia megaterium]MED4169079.1 DUF2071 domain-containing protein [Priestia megaterium]MED4198792.1 DUF2071 domain-containing protein [Priestia megaterium]